MNSVEDLDVFKLAHQLALKTYSTTKTLSTITCHEHGSSPVHDHVSFPVPALIIHPGINAPNDQKLARTKALLCLFLTSTAGCMILV
jgi:hypothetical protein